MTNFALLQQLQESILDRGKLKAVFVCGIPGAGKSYTVSSITDGSIQPRIVNSDKMYEFMGRIGRVDVGDASQWEGIKDVVKRTTQNQLALYINSLLPLFVDSTSADAGNLLRRKGILESFGYDVGVVWVETSLESALARAAQRERHVPKEFIELAHKNSMESKQYILSRFEWKTEINNSEGELTDQIITAAYNSTRAFFNSELSNPIGKRIISELEAKHEKYLVPTTFSLEQLQHLTSAWYKA